MEIKLSFSLLVLFVIFLQRYGASAKSSKSCSKKIDQGRCLKEPSLVYGYSDEEQKCIKFEYKGCGGNSNRFRNERKCKRVCEKKTKRHFSKRCLRKINFGEQCDKNMTESAIEVYGYSGEKCVKFEYYGCGGNHNRFYLKKDCRNACEKKNFHKVTTFKKNIIHPYETNEVIKEVTRSPSLSTPLHKKDYSVKTNEVAQETMRSPGIIPVEHHSNRSKEVTKEEVIRSRSSSSTLVDSFSNRHKQTGDVPGVVPIDDFYKGNREDCLEKLDEGIPCKEGSGSVIYVWGYAGINNKCVMFPYNGCGGNGNKFSDYVRCQQTCKMSDSKWCEINEAKPFLPIQRLMYIRVGNITHFYTIYIKSDESNEKTRKCIEKRLYVPESHANLLESACENVINFGIAQCVEIGYE